MWILKSDFSQNLKVAGVYLCYIISDHDILIAILKCKNICILYAAKVHNHFSFDNLLTTAIEETIKTSFHITHQAVINFIVLYDIIVYYCL